MRLTTDRHDRDGAGLVHVYPVVSRRSRGLSIGINLNPNKACNFRCVYCQVPGLVFGKAPEIDLARLEGELRSFLDEVVHGDFMERVVPEGSRRLNDVAFSGDGEPTSAREFESVVELVGGILAEFGLLPATKLVLITNGSLVNQSPVQRGIERMRSFHGEVWFKLDRATDEALGRTNDYHGGLERLFANLGIASRACPTWIQTCVFARKGEPPSRRERDAYLRAIERVRAEELPVEGVLLYGLARPSHQPEAPELEALPAEWLERFADEIRAAGLPVQVSA